MHFVHTLCVMGASELTKLLKEYWGWECLRSYQEEAISHVLSGRDVLVVVPTGGGKSLCYQLPALVLDGVTLVVSPLIALIEDQVRALRGRGIPAVALHSALSYSEQKKIIKQVLKGEVRVVFMAPERLLQPATLEWLSGVRLGLVAVDEAHCISMWGHEFRPSYLQIYRVRNVHPQCPMLALTGSATPRVIEDISRYLRMREPALVRVSLRRTNIALQVRFTHRKAEVLRELLTQVEKQDGVSLLYVRSRQKAENVAGALVGMGVRASFYHAGLSADERYQRQKAWWEEHTPHMVCTTAFGMGIDKPNVRLVVHLDLPENAENYLQEVGRAGRDGQSSGAVMLLTAGDLRALRGRLARELPPDQQILKVYKALCAYYRVPEGMGRGATFNFSVDEIAKGFSLSPVEIFYSLKALMRMGLVEVSESFFVPAQVRVLRQNRQLYELRLRDVKIHRVLDAVVRWHPQVLTQPCMVQESVVAGRAGVSVSEVRRVFALLARHGFIEYEPQLEGAHITFVVERQTDRAVKRRIKELEEWKSLREEQAEWMVRYVREGQRCRMCMLMEYFGERDGGACGICDNCVAPRHPVELVREGVLSLLGSGVRNVDQVMEEVWGVSRGEVLAVMRDLVDEGVVERVEEGWCLKGGR